MKSLVLFLVILFSLVGMSCTQRQKIAYVNLNQVFTSFPMTDKLNIKLESMKTARKAILDSMYLKLQGSGNVSDSQRQEFLQKQQYFESDNSRMEQEFNDQVWKQINQYVNDYGKEKGYDFILGAEGSGTVMYASEGNNITKEITEYIAKRYEGVKK